jgi:hypothetical protein
VSEAESVRMRRLALLAVLALAVYAVPAVAQTTGTPEASAACTHPDDGDGSVLAAASASSRGDGGVPAGFDGGHSGGTPADWDSDASSLADDRTSAADDATTTGSGDSATTGCDDSATTGSESLAATGTGEATTGSGGALAASAGGPSATAAQEPTPEPQGSVTQQPGDPGTQPPPVEPSTVPGPGTPAAQAPAGGTGGTLPFTGIEALQLALLGIALLLVGARLRVLALRRRRGPAEPIWREGELAYEEDFAAPITARRATTRRSEGRATALRPEPARSRRAERDEWSFPDPDEPAPTGLLPSTASARRRARALAAERD